MVQLGLLLMVCGLLPIALAWLVGRNRPANTVWQGKLGSLLLWSAISGFIGLLVGAGLLAIGLLQAVL